MLLFLLLFFFFGLCFVFIKGEASVTLRMHLSSPGAGSEADRRCHSTCVNEGSHSCALFFLCLLSPWVPVPNDRMFVLQASGWEQQQRLAASSSPPQDTAALRRCRGQGPVRCCEGPWGAVRGRAVPHICGEGRGGLSPATPWAGVGEVS